MRIVALAPYVPHAEIDHAGGSFLNEYLTRMAGHHDIVLFAPAVPDLSGVRVTPGIDLRPVRMREQPRSALRRRWWNLRNFARGLTPGWQLLAGFGRCAELWSEVARADVVEVHWDYLLPLVARIRRTAPGAVIAVQCHDVVAQSFARLAETSPSRAIRVKARVLAPRIRRQEARLLNRASVAYTFSDKDRVLLQQAGARLPIRVLDPFLDAPDTVVGPTGTRTVLFTGAMHRRENSGGVEWFLDEVWAAVVDAVPDARFVVAGSGPPPSLRARAGGSVEITGFVADLNAVYEEADVFVAPLRAGAGLKFKVPQAMLYGLPVVATSVAAEGMAGTDGGPGFAVVSDDPAVLARSLIHLLTETGVAHAIGEQGRQWARERFEGSRVPDTVTADYTRLCAGQPLT